MSYLLLWIGFAIWVFIDSNSRRMNKGALWAIGTLLAGVFVLPLYFSKRNLFTGEVREGGTWWNAVKMFALYWTITMFVAGLAGMGVASRQVADATSSAEQAGAAIGSMLGLSLLFGLWFAVLAGALVIGLFLKKSSVIENGPTGELARQEILGKKLGTWMLLVWSVVACIGIIATSNKDKPGESPQQTSNNSDKLANLALMPPVLLSPTGELAAIFNLMSNNTDLQRENRIKEIKGQVVEWTLPVYEVEKDGNDYKVQTEAGDAVGTFIYISPRNDQDKVVIEGLKTGSQISIKGIIKDDFMRNLVIQPAILFQPVSAQPAEPQPTSAIPNSVQLPAEQEAQQNAGVCADIYTREEVNPGDNDVICSNLVLEIADKELNAVYKSVMADLGPDRQAMLKSEQESWIKVKEKQCDGATEGAINFRQETLSSNQCLTEITNQRIEHLKRLQ
ncbi:MAG: lysozyme inhibitor LprI family protein [Gallionella sp.]|jgi:uncharacterized protein YecT (DUF1311 family)